MKLLMSGKLARSYTEQEVLKQFSRLGMAFGIGFKAGPSVNFVFVNVDFYFLGVHIMFATKLVYLSKEFDFKGSKSCIFIAV